MKYLELTEQKAKDLNAFCQFALDHGVNNSFNIQFFRQSNTKYEINYLRHIVDVAKQYDGVQKLINFSDSGGSGIHATHNTKEFLASGGFLRILKIDEREESIQDYTLKTLRQSAMGTKEWISVLSITSLITFFLAIVTAYVTVRVSPPETSTPQSPGLLQSRSDTALTVRSEDSSKSYKDSLKRLNNNTISKQK